jgi:mercuric ion transport protein
VIGKLITSAGAGIGSAFASALCCAGPLLAVTVGVSAAGLSSTFLPLQPYFFGATVLFLFLGFYLLEREDKKACDPDKPCADVKVRRRMRIMLWTSTIVSFVFVTYPTWSEWVL